MIRACFKNAGARLCRPRPAAARLNFPRVGNLLPAAASLRHSRAPSLKHAIFRALFFSCLALLLTSAVHAAENERRSSLDLSGDWEFKLDPLDVGRTEKWFEGKVPFERTIQVPGSWNAQGVGFASAEQLRNYEESRAQEQKAANDMGMLGGQSEAGRLFHVYPGPGWYRKQVKIPANWKGKIPWLIFNGVHREAEVWINGKSAGTHLSYLTPFRIDLSSYAKPGETITIVARVDAHRRREVDSLMGTIDTCDFVYVIWGGIYQGVTLEATEAARMEDVFVVPHLATETAEIRVTLGGSEITPLTIAAEIADAKGNAITSINQSFTFDQSEKGLTAKIANSKLWSPKTPHLYTARIQLLSGRIVIDVKTIRFGMREFKVQGQKFLLNGKSIFLRGYGDDCVYPNTITALPDKNEFRRRLLVARDYGFNYVRHHSWFPPEEYFDAADELGMMIQPEFPFAYRGELPSTPEAKRSALAQWETIIRLRRNHPSIVAWCRGNEMYGETALAPEMHEIAKRLDPTRLFIDTDGCTFGDKDRNSLDFLVVPFGEEGSMGYQDGKYNFSADIAKPVVGHEMGYFVTLHDLTQSKLFKSGLRPYWLFKTRDLAKQNGVTDVYPEWLAASCRLQALCLKSNMEAARRSRLKGTSVWLFQDYPNCAEGVVDMFFRPKGLRAEEFRKFNSPTVLLLDAPRRNWWGGETAEINFVVSRFEDEPSDAATLHWTLKNEKSTLAEGVQEKLQIRSDGVQKLSPIQLKIPSGTQAERLTLKAELIDANGKTENSWSFWGFPKDSVTAMGEKIRVFAFDAFQAEHPSTQKHLGGPIPAETELLISTKLDQDVREYLKFGGRVLLLEPEPAFPIERTNFRLSAWDGGGPSGTIFDAKHPALRAMSSEGWCDLQFFSLIQGSKTVLLDSLPTKIPPLIRCIDRPTRLANRAYLFEAAVGKGKLLVSGFNFSQTLASKDPAGIFLLNQLVHYASGADFAPATSLPVEALSRNVK
ncbi:MAG: glycoside hydrolase family 2 sugar binding protein [Verrucomicrobiales bacterium]|nr:glycoside hydrolase family 2 sugar binding protein [Verrucomicrobiales bacterium]